mgnify:FL=1
MGNSDSSTARRLKTKLKTAELNILMRISSMAVLGKTDSIWLLFRGDVTLDGAAVIKYFLNLLETKTEYELINMIIEHRVNRRREEFKW